MPENTDPDGNTPPIESSENGSDQSTPEMEIPTQGRLAGIDFGTVRVGVAISDPSQSIASPLEVYTRRSEQLDAKYFLKLAKEESLAGFVVGLPVHMSGDESQKSREATDFGKWLHAQTELPVVWIDERYTTARAREMLNMSNLSGKKRKAFLDKIAAQVILSSWLETRGGSPSGGPNRNLDD